MSTARATDGPAARGRAPVLLPLAVGALAFGIRALHAPAVFQDGRVLLGDPDSYYHLRRILFNLANFPAVLGIDPYLAPPEGARAIWPPLFDTATAWLLRPLWTPGGEHAIEVAAAWLPPLLGALAAAAVVGFGRRLFDDATGAVAGLLVAGMPGHARYSRVGFVDHHAAVALAAILLIAAAAGLLRALGTPAAAPGRRRAAIGACGAGLGGVLLLWPGSLIHVAAVAAVLPVFTATRPDRASAARASLAVAGCYALAALLVAPSGVGAAWPQWSPWTPVVLSRFQPWLFAALALHALACAGLWRRPGTGDDAAGRMLGSLVLGLALLGLSALLLPGLGAGLEEARRWLVQDEVFQAMVAESQPLTRTRGAPSTTALRRHFGDLAFAFPVFLVWLAWASRRRPDRAVVALLLVWAALLAAAALLQRRFSNSATLPYALVTAWALVETGRRLARRGAGGARAPAALTTALLLGLGMAAAAGSHGRPRSARLAQMVALGDWLRAHTPETRGFLERGVRPEYSVMASWGAGHVIRYVGRRAPVVDNFGDDVSPRNFRASIRYFGSHREEAGVAILESLGARYVVVDPINVRLFARSGERSLSHRLYRSDGSGLAQHRLIGEPAGASPGVPSGGIFYKVFERVAGARLRGRAPPGEPVTARLGFTTARGRRGELRWSTVAAADGAWELVVPHATGRAGAIATSERYRLSSAGRAARVRVSERAVREGSVLEAPPLLPPAGAGPPSATRPRGPGSAPRARTPRRRGRRARSSPRAPGGSRR